MRFELNGTSLWFGTPDAPAVQGKMTAAGNGRLTGASVTIAVKPTRARYAVELRYRVNGGAVNHLRAVLARTDARSSTQYFVATLPALNAGSQIDYTAVAKWPEGQIPAQAEAADLSSSFHVVAEAKTPAGDTAPETKPSKPDAAASSHPGAKGGPAGNTPPAATSGGGGASKAQVLSLAGMASQTVAEIVKANSANRDYVAAKIGARRKTDVLRCMKGSAKGVLDVLEKIDYAPRPHDAETIGQAVEAGLTAQKAAAAIQREVMNKINRLIRAGRLTDQADPGTPIERHPLFQAELKLAELYKLTDSVKLAEAKAARLVALASSPAQVDDDMLNSLVKAQTLSVAEANDLGLVLSLCLLAGGSADIAIAMKPKVAALSDIARVSASDWLHAITTARASPPDGLDTAGFAAALRRACANLYPSAALHALTIPSDTKQVEQSLKELMPLWAKNEKIFGKAFDELDTSAIGHDQLPAVKKAYQDLLTLANQHPGLGLAAVLNGHETPAEKITEIDKRLKILERLRAQNPDTEFTGLDYTEDSDDRAALNADGLSDGELHMAVSDLKAAQRVHAITADVDHANALLASGYASGCAVAMEDRDEFCGKSGLPEGTAKRYHAKAGKTLSRASHGVMSALTAYDGPFQRMPVGNVRPGIKDHLKAIPGFAELFGSQDYCNCAECQSILGAPAYFVDLMSFVEENLTGKVFKGKTAKDRLNLKVRRPDLWKLPLTCDNTNTLVSYLDIIVPTLETYIAIEGQGYKGDISDRVRIEKLVYETALSNAQRSFHQPFLLPQEKLDIYLERFDVSRQQIARQLGGAPDVTVRAAFKMPHRLYLQLLDANPDQKFLTDVYGISFAFAGGAGHVNALNVAELVRATGYSRVDLELAVATEFVTKNRTYKIEIRSERKNAESVQNDVEKITGLNADALHRLYRFTRLLRASPWAIADLDLILVQLGASGTADGLDEAVLLNMLAIRDLASRWTIPVDQLCALWSLIPTLANPARPKLGSLFDRLFKSPSLAQTDGAWPRPDIQFVHAAFTQAGSALTVSVAAAATDLSKTPNNLTARLLAGLQVTDTDLASLITSLAAPLGADVANAQESQRGFVLSLANLSLLYRHALLARLLSVRVSDLFQLIQLAGLRDAFVADLDDLVTLAAFFDWYQASGFHLDDLGLMTHGPVQLPATYPDPVKLAARLAATVVSSRAMEFSDHVFMVLLGVSEAESQQMIAGNPNLFEAVPGASTPAFRVTPVLSPASSLQFSDTVLAFLPGVTASQSQQIVAANQSLFAPVPGGASNTFQLATAFGEATVIQIPEGISLDPAAAQAALARYAAGPAGASTAIMIYHPSQILPSLLAGLAGIGANMLNILLSMLGDDLSSENVFQALTLGADVPATQAGTLATLISKVTPLNVLFGGGGFGVNDLSFIHANPSLFGITDFNNLSMANVRKLMVYRQFAAGLMSSAAADTTPLQRVLTAFSGTSHFGKADPNDLAVVLAAEPRHLQSLLRQIDLPVTPPEALASLSAIVSMADKLGLGGQAMKLCLSDDYAHLAVASDAVLGAFRAQFKTDQQFTDHAQPFDNRVRARKRDALSDFLLTWQGYQFNTLNDLYGYFLLDVQLEGIMQTSWVVAAISSVQLYVYRCIMNLEQDDRDSADPGHIVVKLSAEAAEEWTWRQNYRVWQANREVFLFPESYILPELRDNMTPLFEDLQSGLLQQPIDEQNVLDAYAVYMNGLDQLSKLQIAGSYHDIDKDTGTDVLHLFGVTPADPPTFFYRTVENAIHGETQGDRAVTYTPWEPVSLQIHCRQVAPVVYLGRLFVFWTQINTSPINLVVSANSIFGGYKHTIRVNYSSLRLDQTWTPPQQLALSDETVFKNGDGVVMDTLLDYIDKGNSFIDRGAAFSYYGFEGRCGFNASDSETTLFLLAQSTSGNRSTFQNDLISNVTSTLTNPKLGNSGLTSGFSLSEYQATLMPHYDSVVHSAPVDGYTLSGYQWNYVYPTVQDSSQELLITTRNFRVRGDRVDFYNQVIAAPRLVPRREKGQSVLCSKFEKSAAETELYIGTQDHFPYLERYPWCAVVAKDERIEKLAEVDESLELFGSGRAGTSTHPMSMGLYRKHIASVPGDIEIGVINSSDSEAITDAIIDKDGDLLLLQGSVRPGSYIVKRLSTTLGESLCRTLFVSQVDGLLSFDTQASLGEDAPALTVHDKIQNDVLTGGIDFGGAMGTYFWEVFFHAPFLIADQLFSQQNYAAALRWYRYIFDPTANDDETLDKRERIERDDLLDEMARDDKAVPVRTVENAHLRRLDGKAKAKAERARALAAIREELARHKDRARAGAALKALQAQDRAEAARDRVWRFIGFRNLDVPSLRQILTDPAAIAAYEQDPFNPHAIARLRLSAYQKCIVMNYIDILIGWGDSLFTEFEMETVNEATLLYVQASEILGPRPQIVGDCGEGNENQRTYETIAPLVKNGSAFLVEMETYTHGGSGAARAQPKLRPQHLYMIDHAVALHYFNDAIAECRRRVAENAETDTHEAGQPRAVPATGGRHAIKADAERGTAHHLHGKAKRGAARSPPQGKAKKGFGRKSAGHASTGKAPRFAASVVRHVIPAFCVPPNANLLAYWDLVEDRLFKIRHGMDITGALRQLSLFAPPIDPMLLVEATAAGLSLDDVLNATSGDVPPYRFTYLIDKAKQYASQVQGFGGALLSAIEKRDSQTLEVLRVTQQQNILAMTTASKQADIDAAQNAVDTLNAQLDTAQFRHDYFQNLIESGLNSGEVAETSLRALSILTRDSAVVDYVVSAVTSLIPQIGSPFAMTFGGIQLGAFIQGFANSIFADSSLFETLAAAAGQVAGYERRSDGWQHEVDMASKDIAQITTQLVGANIRLKIANQAYAIHQKTIAQNQQIAEFYTSRFSNVALYTWLATTLQTTYRQAYTSAYAMAVLAEQAYRFERNDSTTSLLSSKYWSQAQGGLLAGEMLLADLQSMERRFIETNYRTPEITQSFSMMQISPPALLNLRQNATCAFDIPELAFDLFYPGQFCRKIKAVRLTIPCVAGPLANVGATLTLTGSQLRIKAIDAAPTPVMLTHSAVIATSTAQNDTGVFEFSFRDERYMPFEGAGAISSWKVELPDGFRQFDYQTITDVIVHISYTAQQDGALRQKVEDKTAGLAKTLASQPLGRLYSLRQEFPAVLNRLLHGAPNTPVTMTIGANTLPFFIATSHIQITTAKLLLRTATVQAEQKFTMTVDGNALTGFIPDPAMGNLPSTDASAAFGTALFGDHVMSVTNAGDLAPVSPQGGITAAIDDTALLDIMLYVEYKLNASSYAG